MYILTTLEFPTHYFDIQFIQFGRADMRRRRNRIPNETRERIVRAFEDPSEDYLADTLGNTIVKDDSTKDRVVVEITLKSTRR